MKLTASRLLNLLLIIGAFALVASFYERLPDPYPTHWNLAGKADNFAAKPWGPLALPLTMTGLWLLLELLPRLSPKGFRIDPFARVYTILQNAILGFFFLLNASAVMAALGSGVAAFERLPLAAVGMLLLILGNYMGKITRNFFIGIRTPWTLASDEVWLRTHRLGGKVFVAAGLLIIAGELFGAGPTFMLPVILAAAIVPAVYSFIVYKRIEGFKEAE